MPVLLRVFPQGLDSRDAQQAARLREAYEDWLERGAKQPSVHHAWIGHVLHELLGYPSGWLAEGQALPPGIQAVMANVGEVLRPDMVLQHSDAKGNPILLVAVYPVEQDLEKPISGKLWKATAGTRMMELLHAADLPLGLITNGEEWTLVSAPRGETTGFATWYADLWMQEPLTLRAFHSLLHLRRLIGVAESDTLPALFSESSRDQNEVTDQLGYQVRQAVEVLVQAFDHIDAESDRTLLTDVSEKALYDSALTLMMRLVFLFSAEERGLLLLGDPLYDQNYAVSTLSASLREQADQHGEEVLERRHDAWCRLLSTFRAVHGGVEHEAMRLPPYGGTLFDPNRYPFLEGRGPDSSWRSTPATPLLVNNRVVLHLLEALQLLRMKVPGAGPSEARRLSFRALDIEQIGHVYEGLLDHTAKRAVDPVLGLVGSKDREPEIPLATLEEIAQKGTAHLVEFLRDETGRSEKALKRLLDEPFEYDDPTLLIACGQDEGLAHRVRPFAALLRKDSFRRLVIVRPGSIYVTSGSDRRSTGTHYTPRSLTEPIVSHTLEPIVYLGPADGLPEAEWTLKTAKEILSFKICDMAMGSGAFLVAACRYLGDRLVEAWENIEREHPGSFVVTPDGELSIGTPSERLIPMDLAERIAIARRYVADRCLYGVDINPMAVEMAKLSLWLITLQRDRPFSFLDHALKRGDSLLGVASVAQLENFSLDPNGRQITFATSDLSRRIEDASDKRRALEALPSNNQTQIAQKARLYADAEASTAALKGLADILIAFELRGLDGEAYEKERTMVAEQTETAMRKPLEEFKAHAFDLIRGRRPFHWPLEFPEVFQQRAGFDAVIGNPPFMGGFKLEPSFGADWRGLLVSRLASGITGVRGAADLCAYFFLRAGSLISKPGAVGLIATNTIAQGDTRLVALDRLLSNGYTIYRATASFKWPGTANLEVAFVYLTTGKWLGICRLGDADVVGIDSHLEAVSLVAGNPYALAGNSDLAFKGATVMGMGFILTPEEASALLSANPDNSRVVFPYLNGEDLNSRTDQSASRWVINFFDWPLDRETAQPGYDGPVASDYSQCLKIVSERVKPERLGYDTSSSWNRSIRTYWWRFGLWRPALYSRIKGLKRVIVKSEVGNMLSFSLVPNAGVFSHMLIVFAFDDYGHLGLLQSSIHEVWARHYGSSMRTDLRYTPVNCFGTFPMPIDSTVVAMVSQEYDECRREVGLRRNEGLTKIYGRFHDRNEMSPDIVRLRALHVTLDNRLAAAYGWSELDLDHGFHETKQGRRYTMSELSRRTVLERLLALNHERYAEEVKAGLHEKGAKRTKTKPARNKVVPAESDLFS